MAIAQAQPGSAFVLPGITIRTSATTRPIHSHSSQNRRLRFLFKEGKRSRGLTNDSCGQNGNDDTLHLLLLTVGPATGTASRCRRRSHCSATLLQLEIVVSGGCRCVGNLFRLCYLRRLHCYG